MVDERGSPRFGAYRGSLDRVDLNGLAGPAGRLARRKRWQWAVVSTPQVIACFALVDAGYFASGFAVAADLATKRVVADVGSLGAKGVSVRVGERPAEGARSRFTGRRMRARVGREAGRWKLRLRSRRLSMDAELDAAVPPLTVISPVPGGGVNVTQKTSCLPASGSVEAGGRRYELAGGLGGLDYTHGLLSRRTSWRWAFGCGRTEDGRTVGFNLSEGFNESEHGTENAVWIDGELVPVGRARFMFDPTAILTPWQVTTEDGRVGLGFNPVGRHRENRNLLMARSRLSQLLGTFSGTIDGGDGPMGVSGMPGVAEDQDVVW
ncbi:MAG: DUF2804 domain-containing protein [Actinomycetota bacterium]